MGGIAALLRGLSFFGLLAALCCGRICPIETPEGPEHRSDRFARELRAREQIRLY